MSNCCLKYTDWLSDLILEPQKIRINQIQNLVQPFNPKYSGIWRPLITNTKRSNSYDYLLPYNINPQGSGVQDYVNNLIGLNKCVEFTNPQFNSWTLTGAKAVVDVGMNLIIVTIIYIVMIEKQFNHLYKLKNNKISQYKLLM
jgi:hypothetical protein